MTTTGNATSAASNTVTNSSVPPTLSASNATSGANAIYTISNFAASGANGCGTSTGGTCPHKYGHSPGPHLADNGHGVDHAASQPDFDDLVSARRFVVHSDIRRERRQHL